MRAWVDATYPRADGESDPARRRAVNAKAFDLLRGLLPAASLSHMGIYATGQAYEQLILHLLGHPLPEARDYGGLILDAIKAVMPSFVARVERPERGGEWVAYLERRRDAGGAGRRGSASTATPRRRPPVRAAAARRRRRGPAARVAAVRVRRRQRGAHARRGRRAVRRRPRAAARRPDRRAREPPPPPGPRLRGAALPLRDRLRLRRVPRPPAPPHADRPVAGPDADLGAGVPDELVEAGAGDLYARALERSEEEYERLAAAGLRDAAPYALCLGFRIRYVLDLNAREAMHTIELRSGREGHPSYRAVAHEMHAQIAAHHPAVAAAMTHVDGAPSPASSASCPRCAPSAARSARAWR